MTGCLGAELAALADGTISPRRRERALAHVARCDGCRRALDDQRRVRAALALSRPPAPTVDLNARLLAVAWLEAFDAAPTTRPAPVTVPPPPAGRGPTATTRPGPRAGRLVVVGGTASLMTLAGLTILASAPTAATQVPALRSPATSAIVSGTPARSFAGAASTRSTTGAALLTGATLRRGLVPATATPPRPAPPGVIVRVGLTRPGGRATAQESISPLR